MIFDLGASGSKSLLLKVTSKSAWPFTRSLGHREQKDETLLESIAEQLARGA